MSELIGHARQDISTLLRSVRFMKNVKRSSLVEKLVVSSTELGGLQKRLRSIENVIRGIDLRADDTRHFFTDRDRALLIWCFSSRASLIETRSRIESILAKLNAFLADP